MVRRGASAGVNEVLVEEPRRFGRESFFESTVNSVAVVNAHRFLSYRFSVCGHWPPNVGGPEEPKDFYN